MFKQLIVTFALVLLVLDPATCNAHLIGDASPSQILRTTDGGRLLEAESASTDDSLSNPLFEANTKIKGCKWWSYFLPWSCCGANSC
ncbi:hypothetical protein PHMEG_0004659 [Phytophthora megakarya]|uniref:RxLR effector protein n=1 Tax=Phytophthora megakarya TaxID=4795 RepID=A0A225WTA5_9STRA|nr:hypothetical protein PHMEG_0004659 [Phytophthora megakarya]